MRSWRSVVAACGIVLGLIILADATASAQCSMCRRAFESPEGQRLVSAFRLGILFLLAAPFLSFGVVAWLAVRRQRRRLAAFEQPDPAPTSEVEVQSIRPECLRLSHWVETRL
jgi:hypothetical protein